MKVIKLAHGLDPQHSVHQGMVFLGERLAEKAQVALYQIIREAVKVIHSGDLGQIHFIQSWWLNAMDFRTKEDGSKTLKVILDEKERGGVDYRLDTYSEVYRRLTGRGVVFEFPQTSAADY